MIEKLSLAIEGGTPEIPSGPPRWPPADDEIRLALESAYADGSWGQYDGRNCTQVIATLTALHAAGRGEPHVLLASSGTIAVELALRGLKIGPGDEVILAAYDFAGNFRAVEAVGARPVLVDLAEDSWTLDPQALAGAISPACRAVIVSHLHGTLANMQQIVALAQAAGLSVVEDACQTPGATVSGRIAGSWGDVGIYSFGGSKLLTAGRGGALVTPHAEVAQRIRIYSQRGNEAFPLSELQAAVLVPQLKRLQERNQRRAIAAARLASQLTAAPQIIAPFEHRPETAPAYYKLGLLYRPSCDATDQATALQRRQRFIAAVQAEGVAIDAGFRGFANRSVSRCRTSGPLVSAHRAAQATLVLHHPVLLEPLETIDRVAAAIIKVATALALRDDE